MDMTSTEIAQLLILAAIAGLIGGLVGSISLFTGKFSYRAVVLAPVTSCLLMCIAVFIMSYLGPVPPGYVDAYPPGVDRLTNALDSVILVGIGICVYGTIPAVVGNIFSQFCGRALNKCFFVFSHYLSTTRLCERAITDGVSGDTK